MDQLDRRIIAALQANARASTTQIATTLGVARTTVHERINRMEQRGLIEGYSVRLGSTEDTPKVQVIVMLEVQQKETSRIIKRLEAYPEVKLCLSINGEFDLMLSAEAPRLEDLDILVDDLAKIPGVLRTNTSVVFGRRIDRN
ncbi:MULTISPECIES: Lrp/AsnC family transcriptional regulator [Ruegeria]|jgi:DNA-binding Lrp family transcriptional regulator|uniref:AsnC family transcriptional regulator n=1 Tax=Ruegeria atlantica TaxID=81569 RepID=A0AA90Z453_9RHOB|nr:MULTISPECIES: Lrp/AsnC family transcriptional regulator [Ruegeria]NOC45979.1 AsnC family transcriptional regulator [Ruegeria sp. HKCCD7559]NOC85432.1 AsnC family transcriptional regulator [Ruegeria sp. HKCCD6428]NOC93944.1 AsnC family transcriptional regulator [Ruegeria sp. HKCCD6604]NOD31982.1 AsnC family transcriptional regulator [Ruegeria atlantica]NOD84812.1 AsnC family transcriptional regulator [Ruegeria sp. HKCCD6119]